MIRHLRRAVAIASMLGIASASAHAQPIYGGMYGGGYWGGGGGGGQTPQGSFAQGLGVAAAGAGRYNVETAQARQINANTAVAFNQYVYNSRVQSARVYHEKLARDKSRSEKNADAIRARLRDNPNEVDIARGDALNVLLDEITDPKSYGKVQVYAARTRVGGETIRDIPFQYASAAISISVNQLTQGGAPPALKNNEAFTSDRAALRGLADQLKKEGDEAGAPSPETIAEAKAQILATKAKIEATFARNTPDRVAADKFIKACYGFVKMLETPAVNVLLAGVEKHPDASMADLIGFMMTFNLRFGAAETPRQKDVYRTLYPMLAQLRTMGVGTPGAAGADGTPADHAAAMDAFGNLSYEQLDGKPAAPAPAPQPPQ